MNNLPDPMAVPRHSLRWIVLMVPVTLAAVLPWRAGADGPPREKQAAAAIDFSRPIRPILSDNCFRCHGADDKERKAKLRLDIKEGAFKELRNGGFAIVPGKSAESELIARITAHDPSERMPPPKTNKRVKP